MCDKISPFSLQRVCWRGWNMKKAPTGSLRVPAPAAPVWMETPYAHTQHAPLLTVCIPPRSLVTGYECVFDLCLYADNCVIYLFPYLGSCCAVCESCTYNHRIYSNGQRFTTPDQPCHVCTCLVRMPPFTHDILRSNLVTQCHLFLLSMVLLNVREDHVLHSTVLTHTHQMESVALNAQVPKLSNKHKSSCTFWIYGFTH